MVDIIKAPESDAGINIDLTRSTPPPEVTSVEVAAEAAAVAAEMDAVMAAAPVSPALQETAPELPADPAPAPDAPAPPVPMVLPSDAPTASLPSEGDLPLPPSDADLKALAGAAATAAADPQGSVTVQPAVEVATQAEKDAVAAKVEAVDAEMLARVAAAAAKADADLAAAGVTPAVVDADHQILQPIYADDQAAPEAPPTKLERYTAALHLGGTFHMPGSMIALTVAGDPYLDEDGLVFVVCQKPSRHLGAICVEGLLDVI